MIIITSRHKEVLIDLIPKVRLTLKRIELKLLDFMKLNNYQFFLQTNTVTFCASQIYRLMQIYKF